jgi:hypothetical protein
MKITHSIIQSYWGYYNFSNELFILSMEETGQVNFLNKVINIKKTEKHVKSCLSDCNGRTKSASIIISSCMINTSLSVSLISELSRDTVQLIELIVYKIASPLCFLSISLDFVFLWEQSVLIYYSWSKIHYNCVTNCQLSAHYLR